MPTANSPSLLSKVRPLIYLTLVICSCTLSHARVRGWNYRPSPVGRTEPDDDPVAALVAELDDLMEQEKKFEDIDAAPLDMPESNVRKIPVKSDNFDRKVYLFLQCFLSVGIFKRCGFLTLPF